MNFCKWTFVESIGFTLNVGSLEEQVWEKLNKGVLSPWKSSLKVTLGARGLDVPVPMWDLKEARYE